MITLSFTIVINLYIIFPQQMAGRPPFGGYGQNPQQPFNPNAAEFIPFGVCLT